MRYIENGRHHFRPPTEHELAAIRVKAKELLLAPEGFSGWSAAEFRADPQNMRRLIPFALLLAQQAVMPPRGAWLTKVELADAETALAREFKRTLKKAEPPLMRLMAGE